LAGLVHATVTVRDAERSNRLTTMLLVRGERFAPLSSYFHERNFSISSEDLYARSLGLLIDYMTAKGAEFTDVADRGKLFNRFAHDLRYGTIRDGTDPSNLWWLPRRIELVSQMLSAVTAVSDWLVDRHGTRPLNPWRRASADEQIVFWRKWNIIASRSLLKHLKQPRQVVEAAALARKHNLPDMPIAIAHERPPAFPDDRFDRFLLEGFRRPGKQHASRPWIKYNIRDMMVALLLHAGGLRVSEPFHLWVSDVFANPENPRSAHVRVYHPSDGEIETTSTATGKAVTMNRAAFLQLHHGREPLNRTRRRAGWKNNLLRRDGLYMPVFWYYPHYGELFMTLFRYYIEHVRPPSISPWLFLTENGREMDGKTYADLHRAAILRAGIVPKKALGTTPHGHRHAYGQRLEAARENGLITPKIIQMCMHHRSVVSQETYTQRSCAVVNETLQELAREIGIDRVAIPLEDAFQ
jgi:hypothetical protein